MRHAFCRLFPHESLDRDPIHGRLVDLVQNIYPRALERDSPDLTNMNLLRARVAFDEVIVIVFFHLGGALGRDLHAGRLVKTIYITM